jgi:nitroreductase
MREQGVGTALMHECIRRARQAGATALGLHTSDSLLIAMTPAAIPALRRFQCDYMAPMIWVSQLVGGSNMSGVQQRTGELSVAEAVRAKRAVRTYSPEPVPEELVRAIVNAGRRAQSSKNDQPWIFVVVTEREQLQQLSTAGNYAAHIATSAFTVVLVAPAGYDFDLGQAAGYMQLAAVEHGIGSCVTTLHHSEAAHALLGVPSELTCRWSIAFGYSAEAPAPLKAGGRRPLEEVVRYERYSS